MTFTRDVDAERMRYLLEPMMTAIPSVKPSTTGSGTNCIVLPAPTRGEDDQDEPRKQTHDEHAGGADVGHDGEQHHRHRPGRPAHLQVAAAEDRREDSGDDRRDEARFGTEARRLPERKRERERDERDGQPGDDVSPRISPHREDVVSRGIRESARPASLPSSLRLETCFVAQRLA